MKPSELYADMASKELSKMLSQLKDADKEILGIQSTKEFQKMLNHYVPNLTTLTMQLVEYKNAFDKALLHEEVYHG